MPDEVTVHGKLTVICGQSRVKVDYPRDRKVTIEDAERHLKMVADALEAVQSSEPSGDADA